MEPIVTTSSDTYLPMLESLIEHYIKTKVESMIMEFEDTYCTPEVQSEDELRADFKQWLIQLFEPPITIFNWERVRDTLILELEVK